MSESSLPPTPKNSNAGLFILAGVLLAAGAAFLVWRSMGSSEPTALTEPTLGSVVVAASSTLTTVVGASPPPPPPPPPPPASVAEATQTSAPQVATVDKARAKTGTAPTRTQADPCSASCDGTAHASFAGALRQRAGQARTCYDRSLRQDETLQGKLTVQLRVSPEGTACRVSIAQDSMNNATINACIVRNFSAGTYPAPRGGCVDAQIPLNFVAQ